MIKIIFTLLLLTTVSNNSFSKENRDTDSLLKILPGLDGAEKFSALEKVARHFLKIDPAKSLEFSEEAMSVARNLNSNKVLANAYLLYGLSYDYSAKFNIAIKYYKKALEQYKQLNDKDGLSDTYSNLGIVYKYKGDYKPSLDCFLKSLRIKEAINDSVGISKMLNNICLVYHDIGEYDKALEYQKRSLAISQYNKTPRSLAISYINIGSIYYYKGEYDKALSYYKKVFDLGEQSNDKEIISKVYNNYALIYIERKIWDKAILYSLKSLELKKEIGDSISIVNTYSTLGDIYFEKNEFDAAKRNYKKAIDIATKLNMKESMLNADYNMSKFYKKTGNNKKALEYYQKYSSLKDSVMNEEIKSKIAELELEYKVDKKERENNILKMEKDNQTIIITLLTVILILLALSAIFIFLRFNTSRKAARLLRDKNRAIRAVNSELNQANLIAVSQAEKLQELNESKDKFFSIIAHDLKNPFWVIIEMSKMLKDKFESLPPEKVREMIRIIHDSSEKLFGYLENLLQWTSSQTGKLKFMPQELNLKNVVEKSIEIVKDIVLKKELEIDVKLYDNITVYSDLNMLNTIIGNILSNSIKFTPRGGEITLSGTQNDHFYELSVADTGIGFDRNQLQNIFRQGYNSIREGTESEKGTGLGLLLCKEFVEKNGGKLFIESEVDKGSKVTFTIPIPEK